MEGTFSCPHVEGQMLITSISPNGTRLGLARCLILRACVQFSTHLLFCFNEPIRTMLGMAMPGLQIKSSQLVLVFHTFVLLFLLVH